MHFLSDPHHQSLEMELCRLLRWGLVAVLLELAASGSYAAWSNDTTLSACQYPTEDLYVSSATQMQVPTVGYLECSNATGSDVELCAACTCREKRTASTGGVTVAWVVCVEEDQASCAASGREYCASSTNASAGVVNDTSRSSSRSGDGIDAGDTFSGSHASSSGSAINASEAGVDAGSGLDSGSTSSSSDSDLNVDSSTDTSASTSAVETLTLPPQEGQATNEDNVITDTGDVGTVEPSPTNSATSPVENIIRPSGSNSAHALDTTNTSSNGSSWSSKRLTVVASVMCGIAAVAAVAVFVAVRNDRAKKRKMPGTPADDFTDDDSALATPMTERFDGARAVYRHNNHSRREHRYYAAGKRMSGASDDAPLASIVVIGPGDDFVPPASYASTPNCQPYAEARRKSSQGASRSRHSSDSDTKRPQSKVASFPTPKSASPEPEPALNTSNTRVSFSSSTSSASFAIPPSSRGDASEYGPSLNDSFRLVSATYSETDDTYTSSRGPSTFRTTNDGPTANTIVSFESSLSSLSSLDSSQYDVRDTEASEHMHDSEDGMMYTSSSRVPVSFDASSVSTEF